MSLRLLNIARWILFSICFVLLLITRRKRRNREPVENDYGEGKNNPIYLNKYLASERESLTINNKLDDPGIVPASNEAP